jgi:hypothetical protein
VGAGPYARVLAEEIVKPGVEAVTMFRRVQVRVRANIGQEPWLGFNGLGEVHFAGLTASSPSRTDVMSQAEGTGDDVALAWSIVKDSNDLRSLEAFRRQYGKGNAFFDRLAEARIEEVKKNVASLPPSVERRKEALSADTRADYVRQVQLLLKARRCYSGELNGSSRDTQVGVDLFATSSARRGLAKVAHIQLASATIAEFENWLEWARSSDPSRGDICIAQTGSRPTAQKPRTDPSPKAAAPRREAPARQPGAHAPSMTGVQ